ncbi:MAG: class I SAM-dependent methyltransferase [Alphaproteobacteria bacterium]|nr:class I SAM-dependent methyltransferase [Alphaproteobacteria bacterium]
MENSDIDFTDSIPEFYDTYLAPLIFGEFAEDLAKRVMVESPKTILETAAGTGVVTRVLAPQISPDVKYVVTDLEQEMLDFAQNKQPEQANVIWQLADAQDLPFDDASFDAVICQLGFMFFPDKIKAAAEAKRVLKPGGEFIFNVWDRLENNVFADLVSQAAAKIFPDDPPLFLERIPFGYYDNDAMRKTLQDGGFKHIIIQDKLAVSTAGSALHVAMAFTHGTPLRNEIEARDPDGLQKVALAAVNLIEDYLGKGEISAQIQGFVITAS